MEITKHNQNILNECIAFLSSIDTKKFLIAFSGGHDSSVLLHGMCSLRKSHNIQIRSIHVNHHFHNEAELCAKHCLLVVKKFGLEHLTKDIYLENHGNIEQYGTPNEIYKNPSNVFVAEFIGMPKMNIIKINKKNILNKNTINFLNNKIIFENYNFSDEIYIGIRPEDIELNDKNEIKLEIKTDLIENLGFEKIIHSTISNEDFIIKTQENISNELKHISFAKNKIFLFDKNKMRIRN